MSGHERTETLDFDEALDQRIAQHRFDRLIMRSDGVLVIAATLSAIQLKLPEDAIRLGMQLSLLTYLVSCSLIAIYSQNSGALFARLRRADVVMTLRMSALPASCH